MNISSRNERDSPELARPASRASDRLTHAAYLAKARQLLDEPEADQVQLAILSSFTALFLEPYLVVESARLGMPMRPWFGPFNQLEQVLMDADHAVWNDPPTVVWIAVRIEDGDPSLVAEAAEQDAKGTAARLEALVDRLTALAEFARARFDGPVFVSNFSVEPHGRQVANMNNPDGLGCLVDKANRSLARTLAGSVVDAHVFDYAGCVSDFGAGAWRDQRLWHVGRIPMSSEAQPVLASAVVRAAAGALRPRAKCIVVDLDDTLWGGVIGDDGIEGLELGDTYPGSVFKEFQRQLLTYRSLGFLLAVVSKNNEAVAMECVRDHPEMILRPEHFASFQSNWEPKPENLRRVAKELDIGLDSLVFVDDNPVERAAVRAMLPEVTVVELPSQPIGYLDALRSEPRLDVLRASVDDAKRAEMYQQEHRRKVSSNVHESLEQFLEGLKMEATTGELAHGDLDRVHQLVSKTNQFNLTTRRHTAAYIDTLSKSPDAAVLWMRLKDRFGDLGLVCVGILQHVEGRQWEIDTLLMSCRVMGRGVEDAFLAFLHGTALERGAEYVRGVFVPTSRNIAVQDFYSSRGYRWVRDAPGGETEWELELTPESATWPSHIFRARTSLEADHA